MARRFKFSLDPVLDQRRRIEEERLRAVAQIEQERVRLEDRIRAVQAHIRQSRTDLRERLLPGAVRGGISAVRFDTTSGLHLTLEAQQRAIELAGVMRRLERARATLLEATTARKGVERLRERRFDEWKAEITRRENAEVDEIGTIAAARAAMTAGGTL